jgi:hypothetical protein
MARLPSGSQLPVADGVVVRFVRCRALCWCQESGVNAAWCDDNCRHYHVNRKRLNTRSTTRPHVTARLGVTFEQSQQPPRHMPGGWAATQ